MSTVDRCHLHFDLAHVPEDVPVQLHVGSKKILLEKHTDSSRQSARTRNQALTAIPDHRLTHHVFGVSLPAERPQMLLVTTPSKVKGAQYGTLLLSTVHIPRNHRKRLIHERVQSGHFVASVPHPKLAAYGANHTMASDPNVIIDVHDFKTAFDAAVSIVFHHVELISTDGGTSASVSNIIEYSNGISDLAMQILQQATAHQKDPSASNWVNESPYLDNNLKPSSTNYYKWSDATQSWSVGPLQDSLRRSKNDPSLQSTSERPGVYTVQQGRTDVSVAQGSTRPALRAVSADSDYWTLTNLTPHHGFEQSGSLSFEKNVFSISFTNSWLRWLSGFVEFLGPDGSPVTPANWETQLPHGVPDVYDSDTKKYAAIFSATNTILAIPVGNTPTEISFTWPSNASAVKILAGGIGRTGGILGQDGQYVGGWDKQVCTPGAIMTGIFNFGIPSIALLFGAAIPMSPLNSLAKSILATVMDVAVTMVNGPVASALQGGNTTTVLTAFADLIPRLLLDIADLAAWVDANIAADAVEDATPIFGWIAMAVNIITDVALLTETSAEVASSPATFTLVASRSIDAQWTLLPDKNHQNTWPLEATHYTITATYEDGTTRSTTGQMTGSPQTGPITVGFDKSNDNRLPAGGQVMFSAKFYSDTGWLAGSAVTGFMSADVSGNQLVVPQMNITENLVPLTSSTTYQFDKKLAYDAQASQLAWTSEGGPPTSTVKDLDPTNVGNNLGSLVDITISQQTSEVGYAWQASGQGLPLAGESTPFTGQMFAFQAIDDRSTPADSLQSAPAGFVAKAQLLFDINGPASTTGWNFWVDPRNGLNHVRPLTLAAGTFDLSTGRSMGRFNQQVDAAIVHPTGFVVGVNTTNSKLEVLRLGAEPVADADAPLANMYSGYGTRPGLLHLPVGIAATPNAGVIVLEAADSNLSGAGARLQAFDLLGNPAPIFASNASTALLREERTSVTVLDLAVESKGFIYVLKYLGDGSSPDDYRVDIYNPDGTWLSQSVGISAGKFDVDLWRTMYTLNFEAIVKPDKTATQPSVSIWLPSTPS